MINMLPAFVLLLRFCCVALLYVPFSIQQTWVIRKASFSNTLLVQDDKYYAVLTHSAKTGNHTYGAEQYRLKNYHLLSV